MNIETETKQETEVDIPFEEEKGAASSAEPQQRTRQHKIVGLPLGLKIKTTEFQIENGRIESLLYKADEKGNVRQSQLITSEPFMIDTRAKRFGRVYKQGLFEQIELKPRYIVDAELSNPQKLQDFIVRKTAVPLPREAKCPFAILSGGQVLVFWTHTETYRDYWVKALESLRNLDEEEKDASDAGAAAGQLELSEDNWYASQIYMFLKREHTIFGSQAAQSSEARYEQNTNQDQDGEGGGEPATNAEDEGEKKSKAFSLQTVSNDSNQIKGYLYKTAQSLGLLQSHYFLRRYYVLNKETATLTVHDKPGGKADHSVKLTDCLRMVDTNLNTFLKPDFQQHFKENVSKLQLLKDNPLPFALFIKDKMAILWAATDTDYDLWTTAFQKCQSMEIDSEPPTVQQVRNNRFVTSLLSALRNEPITGEPRQVSRPRVHSVDARRDPVRNDQPLVSYQSSTMVIQENSVEGKLMKTSQRLSSTVFKGVSTEYFLLRRYKLDLTTKTMYIMRLGKSKPDVSMSFNESNNRVISVDDRISSQLVINYHSFFKRSLKSDIVIPQDYPFPLVVRLQDNQVMMLWIASEFERSVWAKQFREMIHPDSPKLDKEEDRLITTDANEFIATVYRCLVPLSRTDKGSKRQVDEPTTGYKIRIVQQGLLMKTSQKAGNMMQKKNFHMRFFNLNVSTGIFKVFYGMTPDGKVKHAIDLRNKVLAVTALIPKLNPAIKVVLRQYKVKEDFMLPHDFKMPFAVIYEDNYKGAAKLGVMILWAQTDKVRQQWIEAFKYIRVENNTLLRKDVPLPRQIDICKNNFFCVILFQHLEMPQVEEDSNEGGADFNPGNDNSPRSKSRHNKIKKIKEQRKSNDSQCSPQEQPRTHKRLSELELIEDAWKRYKTETPVETLISGQTTFQIQSKCSMGLIRARKELFDNNYDPETIVKCFLLIDFDNNLVGIRSVDSSFSAMVKINGTDLVRLQDNFSYENVDESSIDLILASNKVLRIASNHASEHSLIYNELNRAKIMGGQAKNTERAEAEDTASNQQQESQQDLVPSIQHSANAAEPIHQLEEAKVDSKSPKDNKEKAIEFQKDNMKYRIVSSDFDDEQPIGPSSPCNNADQWQRKGIAFINPNKAPVQQRQGRFAREDVAVDEENRGNRTRKKRQSYANDQMTDDANAYHQQLANNEQDLEPLSPQLGRDNAPQRHLMKDSAKKDDWRPQVIPLNKIKFSGGQETPQQQQSFKLTPKMRNSFMQEAPVQQTSQQTNALLDRIQRLGNANESSSGKQEGVDFFQPQSKKTREQGFVMQQPQPSPSRGGQPIKIKLSKKRPTEDSQVRQSLQQAAILNNTVPGKIDFHQTTSFRDAFPAAGAAGKGPRPLRPGVPSDNDLPSYEAKIQASRDQGFIENLITQQTPSVQLGLGQMAPPVIGNRFMSPAVRLSQNQTVLQSSEFSVNQPFNSQPADCIQSPNAGYITQQPNTPHQPPIAAFNSLAADPQRQYAFHEPDSEYQTDSFNRTQQVNNQGFMQQQPQRLNTAHATDYNSTQPVLVQPAKRSMTHDKKGTMMRGHQGRQDGELSDWDDDSGDEFAAKIVKQPLTNVRDRTISLNNVYNGQILSPKAQDQAQSMMGSSARQWFSNYRDRKPSQNDNDLEVEDWD